MSGLIKGNHGIPCLVVECLGSGQVMRRQVKVLLHVREPQTGARVIVLGVQRQGFVNNLVRDGREEDAEIGGHVVLGVDSRVGLAVGLVLLVGQNYGAGEVEALLVELGLVLGDLAIDDW